MAQLAESAKGTAGTFRKFFIQHHSRKPDNVDRRLQEIRGAVPATHDVAVTCSCSAAVLELVRIVRAVRDAILSYDQQIETLAGQYHDFAIVDSLPGAGPALAPRLIAALGTQRDRYNSASELQSYSGIAPVVASRKAVLDTLALGLSQVCPTDISRVGSAFHRILGLGQSILRAATVQGQATKYGREGSGVQVDSPSLSLLETT